MSHLPSSGDSSEFLLLDSCVVGAYYLPASASRSSKLHPRAAALIDSVRNSLTGNRRLLIPDFCIGEVFSMFAKHRFGKWNKQVRKPLTDVEYWRTRQAFRRDIHNGRVLQQYMLSRYHVLATDLISPIDHNYEFYRSRGRKKRKVPMAAFDHLFVAMGIELVKNRGWGDVSLVTADDRLDKILTRAGGLRKQWAARLGLLKTATDLGLRFGSRIYPRVINLANATRPELAGFFGVWPPPDPGPSASPTLQRLSRQQKKILATLYRSTTTESADSLAGSAEFEILYDAFLTRTGLELTRHRVWTELVNLRKSGGLPTRGRR